MNILDENIINSQRLLLLDWRIPVRQIGFEIGRKGMQDAEIIPLLHQQKALPFSRMTTTFTTDSSATTTMA